MRCAPQCLSALYVVADGHSQGPVTFTLDSRKFEYVDQQEGSAGSSGTPAKATKQPRAEQEGNPPSAAADAL